MKHKEGERCHTLRNGKVVCPPASSLRAMMLKATTPPVVFAQINTGTGEEKHKKQQEGGAIGDPFKHFQEKVIVRENITQHKYAKLANASYDYFDSKGDANLVERNLKNVKNIPNLGEFKVDTELSTLDNVVLHNPITKETHISYRGTAGDIPQLAKDWSLNGKIAFAPKAVNSSKRMTESIQQAQKVVEKYGTATVSGHSQGGFFSFEMAHRFNFEGHHFNPALSVSQLNRPVLTAEQEIYKTHLDFASPLAYVQKSANVNLVNTALEEHSVQAVHSLEQFTPPIRSAENGLVQVERNSLRASLLKSSSALVGVAAQGYFLEKDIEEDVKTGTKAEKTAKVSIDVLKNAEQFTVDTMIMDGAILLAPETMGLSLVVGLGLAFANDLISGAIAEEAKEMLPSVVNWFKNHF